MRRPEAPQLPRPAPRQRRGQGPRASRFDDNRTSSTTDKYVIAGCEVGYKQITDPDDFHITDEGTDLCPKCLAQAARTRPSVSDDGPDSGPDDQPVPHAQGPEG